MKLRVTLVRPDLSVADIAITAEPTAKIGELADAILEKDPHRAHMGAPESGESTLEITSLVHPHPTILEPDEVLGDVLIAAGVQIKVVPKQSAPRLPVAVIEFFGAERSWQFEIPRGSSTIGRGEQNDIILTDTLLSKNHARVHVSANAIELVDLNSANGVLVQGLPVDRLELQAGQYAQVGGLLVRAALLPQQQMSDPKISEIVFTRSPSVEDRYLGSEIEGADPPEVAEPQPFPWIAMVVPLLAGVAMYLVTRSMLSIVFVAMSPLLMLGTWFTNRTSTRKKAKQDRERFQMQLDRLHKRLHEENELEVKVRRSESLSLAEIVSSVMYEGPAVWLRRAEHWNFSHLRLGVGTVTSRNTVTSPTNPDRAKVEDIEAIEAVTGQYKHVEGVPVVENFEDAGAIGVCGEQTAVSWFTRGIAAQVAGTHGPQEFVMCGIFGSDWSSEFEAMKWLPHATQSDEYFGGVPFADSASAAMHVLATLEEIVASRAPANAVLPDRLGAMELKQSANQAGASLGKERGNSSEAASFPPIMVFISDDAPVDRARLIQLLENSGGRGVFPVWVATDRARLPAACRTFVEFKNQQAQVGYVRLGTIVEQLQPEGLTGDEFATYVRKLAAYVDAGVVNSTSSDVPRTVSMLSLIGQEMATNPDAVIERWGENGSLLGENSAPRKITPKLRAIVGQTSSGAMHLDLRAQGPHALVGGTTGSGKSEFLQAWVLGMAAEYSPQRVTFLFVDYKGGAAFADCTNLPHCVGLVTDLSPHLVRRALVSLRAELHYREILFTQKKAKDLIDLEKRGDPDAPPALVIVIDEFAALVSEVPEFVDGVVDIAQRGRSLGIHLIMATQRPAGVIKDNLRANTNLRVALRMADETDSDDVIGDKMAGGFDPGIPGRAAAKTGPGRLSVFQSAYAGGWSFAEEKQTEVDLETFDFGLPERWETPEQNAPLEVEEADLGPNDQQRLVNTIVAASTQRQLKEPRRPWLDELAEMYDLTKLLQRTDERLLLGVQDQPQRQKQESVYFEPDVDGHLAVFGTGGSGKSVLLRTLSIAAGITPRGGLVDVYALDFGAGGLRMLEGLPHVGAVISGDSSERVRNLFKLLKEEITRRAAEYAEINAGTIVQYRALASKPEERRILLVIDGFPVFRNDYEGVAGRAESYETFQQIMSDGRAVGLHVALSADRGQSLPSALQAMIQRRVVLRMADSDGYAMLGAPRDVLGPESVPGRAIIDELESQIAVIGGTRSISDQAATLKSLAEVMVKRGRQPAVPIRSLPELYSIEDLPENIAGEPVLGLSEEDLRPIPFDPTGLLVIGAGPGAGRTNTLAAVALSLQRAKASKKMILLANGRSELAGILQWDGVATDGTSATMLIDELTASGEPLDGVAVFIEGATDFSTSLAEMSLSTLAGRAKRGECLIVSDGDTSDWHTGFGLMGALKASRRGLVLAPDMHDGEMIFKTPFPRLQRREFPPGRAMYVVSGKAIRVQLPLVLGGA